MAISSNRLLPDRGDTNIHNNGCVSYEHQREVVNKNGYIRLLEYCAACFCFYLGISLWDSCQREGKLSSQRRNI